MTYLTNDDNLGYEQIVVSSSAVRLGSGLAAGVPEGATMAVITVEAADVRYKDGPADSAPDSTHGILLPNGSLTITTSRNSLKTGAGNSSMRFIRTAAADATLNIAYYFVPVNER